MPEKIKHIWFDLAGMLYKETPEFQAIHDQYRYQTYARLTGLKDIEQAKQEFEELYKIHGSNSAVFRSLGQPSDYWMKAIEELDFAAVLKTDTEITNTLDELQKHIPISLFTNFPKHRIVELLKHLEIPAEWFMHILTGDDITERKPALDGFHLMIERSGIPAEQILYIGDRVDVDIKPAKAVGMQTGLLYQQSEEADYCFHSFDEVLKLFKKG